jgi:hypothetical protein
MSRSTSLLLSALLKDMDGRSVTRLPVLDDRRPGWVVHKATVNEFLAQGSWRCW